MKYVQLRKVFPESVSRKIEGYSPDALFNGLVVGKTYVLPSAEKVQEANITEDDDWFYDVGNDKKTFRVQSKTPTGVTILMDGVTYTLTANKFKPGTLFASVDVPAVDETRRRDVLTRLQELREGGKKTRRRISKRKSTKKSKSRSRRQRSYSA